MSWRRVRGVLLQNLYVMRHSPIRIMELLYWPFIEVVLWGFLTNYLAERDADVPGGVTVLLGAVVLWDVCFRTQQEMAMTQLMDMWDRSILNLYASPLRQREYVTGAILFSLGRVLVGTVLLVVFTRVAFGFDILTAGAVLLPAFAALLGMGWALGLLIRAAVLRFGSNAEVLAWSLALLLQPISAVFYPIASLPGWLQPLARLVPAAHVFEALRAFLADGVVEAGHLLAAGLLDVAYLVMGGLVLAAAYRSVRVRGLLSRPGY
ncbi:MAG: ABC transporter permease [Acidimicrobiia bacterium]|nr:ABC transporter permease [Acidimicrobiia bacterium]